LVFFGFTPRVLAQDESFSPLETLRDNISNPSKNSWQWIYGEMSSGEVNENGILPAIQSAFLGQISGIPDESGGVSGGMLNITSNAVASIYANPAASGVYYAYDVLHNMGVAPAYAQTGVGFSGLQPILPIWKAFRNIAYSVFAIVFVAMGLMVMFRVKISPQAVLTVENALPKMIGVLILITFSYAIAGFMIDLMYVVMGLGINLLRVGGISPTFFGIDPTPAAAINSGFVSLVPAVAMGFWGALKLGFFTGLITTPINILIGTIIGGPFGWATALGGSLIGAGLFTLIWVVLALYLMIRLLLALIKVYIGIILGIIFSPLQILIGALPGSTAGFGGWIKGLAANLLVFPAVFLVMLIGYYIISNSGSGLWYPPLMGPPGMNVPVLGNISAWTAGNFITGVIGMGTLLVLPNIPQVVKGAFGIKDEGLGAMLKGAVPFAGYAQEKLPEATLKQGASFTKDKFTKAKIGEKLDGGKWSNLGRKTVTRKKTLANIFQKGNQQGE